MLRETARGIAKDKMRLAFQTGSAIVRLTMTDKIHYPDLFKTINIPETEKNLALEAQTLFGVANGAELWRPEVFAHMSTSLDNAMASQVFWNFENDSKHTYDRLVLTAMHNGLTIALEHRDFDHREASVRKSLIISQGVSRVYTSDLMRSGLLDLGSTSELAVASFKENLLETTAHLGLYRQIKQIHIGLNETDQNESSSAIFASAA